MDGPTADEPAVTVVMTTVANVEAGEKLAFALVEAKLAACVQILPPMTSVYLWDGRVTNETEHLILIKTIKENIEELGTMLKSIHPYDVPEIITIDAANVSVGYLKWMKGSLSD